MNDTEMGPEESAARVNARLSWVRPELRRISAGSAEFGIGPSVDNGVNYS